MRFGSLALWLCVPSTFAVAAPPASAPQSRPAQIATFDHWYSCLLGTQKLGWMRATRTVADGEVTTSESTSLTIRRGTIALTISSRRTTVETADGQPVRFSYQTDSFGMRQTISGTVEGDKLHLRTQSPTGSTKRTIPLDPEARWLLSIEREQERLGLEAGTTGSVKAYMPELSPNTPVTLKWTVGETVTRQVAGRPMRVTPIVATIAELPGVTINTLLDENREIVEYVAAIGGLRMRMIRSSRAEALKPGSVELFFSTLVKIEKPLPATWKIRRGTFLLRSKDGQKLHDLPNGAGQTVRRLADDQLRVTVARGPDTITPAATRPYAGEADMAAYLANSQMIDHENEQIAAAAKRIVGDETDALAAARKLERFVHKHVRSKNLSRGMDPASIVMARREGDCTEHAVLLAALCRAAGIPARCATGLIYVRSLEAAGPCFGYHMWTEIRIGDQWVGLDATRAKGRISATHIRLTSSALSDAEGKLAFVRGITVVGNLKITPREIELDQE